MTIDINDFEDAKLLITPDATIINGIAIYPAQITIVTRDGVGVPILDAIEILGKAHKVKRESKFRRFKRAFKQAYDEANSDHAHDEMYNHK